MTTGRDAQQRVRNSRRDGRSKAIALFLVSAFCLLPSALSACPVCFGDSSSKLTMGAQNGILFLLAVIGIVQVGFIALFWTFWRRAKALRARREQFQLIDGGTP